MSPTSTISESNTTRKSKNRNRMILNVLSTAFMSIGLITNSIGQISSTGQTTHPITPGNTFKSVEIETVFLTYDKCIKFGWGVRFKINGGSGPTGGYIIQKIKSKVNIYNCSDSSNYSNYPNNAELWEAFEVGPNTDTALVNRKNYTGKPHNDLYRIPTPDYTFGDASVKGTVAFIANPPGGGSALDSTWRIDSSGQTGSLPFTTTKPPWWKDMRSSKKCRKHNLDVTWNCCHMGADTFTYDTTTAYLIIRDDIAIEPVRTIDVTVDDDLVGIGMNKNGNVNENSENGIINESYKNEMNQNRYSFDMYPNPTSEYITVRSNTSLEKSFQIDINTITGQLIRRIITDKKETLINLKDYSKGIYFIIVQNSNEDFIQHFRIVKK